MDITQDTSKEELSQVIRNIKNVIDGMLLMLRDCMPVEWNTQRSRYWRFFRFVWIAGVLMTLVVLSTWYLPEKTNNLIDFWHSYIISFRPKPIILLWTPYFSEKNWLPSMKNLSCSVDCYITSDRKHLKESDAVIFHLRNVDVNDLPPWAKNAKPKWVLFNKEAPPHVSPDRLRALDGKIHWTAFYTQDSTFQASYGKVAEPKSQYISRDTFVPYPKPYPVCWIVSHCTTPSQRESYAKALSQYIPVTIYGACGTNTCPKRTVRSCYEHIAPYCKFYLSFENSICKDYVTEKLFYALDTDMVSIVMGGANYSQKLPPHSYINALDYPSPKDLAEYLLELDNHPNKFIKYHEWKENYEIIDTSFNWACDLCKRLYDDHSYISTDTYTNLSSWWIESANCRSWTDFNFKVGM